jgi:hypothetical protein
MWVMTSIKMPGMVWENRVPRGRLKSDAPAVTVGFILVGEQSVDAVQMRVV